ncbi:MAG: Sb-PDE family phosphodiesterase [Planctomycetota bacterium]|jgi:hypothetical protein
MKNITQVFILKVLIILLLSPQINADTRREINFPDILGYKTIKCDFHMHTSFSDGVVWPTVRVDEAFRESLDAIAITDHIEYKSHISEDPCDHNRSYEIAQPSARESNILLIQGTEITRDFPPGHFNAIFTNDNNPLDTEEFLDTIKQANEQNAFIFWNHPPKQWHDIHTTMLENKWLHGIEVINNDRYYPHSHKWALEKNLTIIGNSDIHDPSLIKMSTADDHRPITLVFAKEKTLTAIKEALFAGRTAIWTKNKLIGKEEYLQAMFEAAVKVGKPHIYHEDNVWVEIDNKLDLPIILKPKDKEEQSLTLFPNAKTGASFEEFGKKKGDVKLEFFVENFIVAPEKTLLVELTFDFD